MSRRTRTIEPGYFDALYAEHGDPWRFRTSAYEREKYDRTLAVLERPHYRAALEIGCSIGVFTARLARRCGSVLAMDASAVALRQARETLAGLADIVLVQGAAPRDVPRGSFDLIVVSEVLYYLDRRDATETVNRCCDSLAAGGELVFCHWLGETDYPLTGDDAAAIALEVSRGRGLSTESTRTPDYRLDRMKAAPARRGRAPNPG